MGIQVSNMGRIKPSRCYIVYGSKSGGYLVYGKPRKYVHVIVAETFLPNPEKKPEVNHKDKDGTNNLMHQVKTILTNEDKTFSQLIKNMEEVTENS